MAGPLAGLSGLNNSAATAGGGALARLQSNSTSLTGLQNAGRDFGALTSYLQTGNITGQSLMGMGGVYGELGGLLNNTYQIVGGTIAGVLGDVQNYAARKQQENLALAPLAQQEMLLQQLQKALGGQGGGAAGAGGANPLAALASMLGGQGGAAGAGAAQQNPFAALAGQGGAAGAGGAQQNPMQAIVALFAMLLQGLQGQRQAQ